MACGACAEVVAEGASCVRVGAVEPEESCLKSFLSLSMVAVRIDVKVASSKVQTLSLRCQAFTSAKR